MPGAATLSLDGSREVRFPTRADFCTAGRIQERDARGDNAGSSPQQEAATSS